MKYDGGAPLRLRSRAVRVWLSVCLVAGIGGTGLAALPALPLRVGAARPAELPGLQNVFRLSEKLYSGAQPEGKAGFQSLRALGVRTIISVDGVRPDVETARRYGMRYVHLPFGYDGCPAPRALEITRAVRDLPGPIYLHCHHGKHRSAAAAALVHIALDGATNAEAVAFMRRAGTDPAYAGLYGEVASFRRPTAAEIDRAPDRFPDVSPLPPLAESMVQIDARFAALQRCRQEGWRAPRGHPDPEPAREALQLSELFHELLRAGAAAARPADFRRWMSGAESGAAGVESALRAGEDSRACAELDRVGAECAACHARYRNVPQTRGPGAVTTHG
jgi:protein tyrosine phosphatase (PTP) superfamily phosphohydrolase (DUF442 family)